MTEFRVPLVIRGRLIATSELKFGGRRGGVTFSTPDIRRHIDELVLRSPSDLGELYDLSFDEVLDYLAEVGDRLDPRRNGYMEDALRLAISTSGLTEPILRHLFGTLGKTFSKDFVRELIDSSVGIPFLEGWVGKRMKNGALAHVRAIGARAVHIIAGNVPGVAAQTIVRNAALRSDAIIKTPSNDPLTAAAIVQTMVDMAPDHPVTRHVTVAYWKGGDASIEDQIYQPRNIDKIVAWGGLASIKHISKYIQPGIDLITLDPKLSSTIIGKEAFADEATMRAVAKRLAVDIGNNNQEACLNARVVYIQSGTHAAGLDTANSFGKMLFDEIQALPSRLSTPVKALEPQLAEEIQALKIMRRGCHVIGGGLAGAVLVSQTDEPVDFSRLLTNRVANLVPIESLETAIRSVTAYTQTIGIYPDSLKPGIRDRLAFHGAQRLTSLGYATRVSHAGPHDGIEPIRRMAKWIVDEDYNPTEVPLASDIPG